MYLRIQQIISFFPLLTWRIDFYHFLTGNALILDMGLVVATVKTKNSTTQMTGFRMVMAAF